MVQQALREYKERLEADNPQAASPKTSVPWSVVARKFGWPGLGGPEVSRPVCRLNLVAQVVVVA